MPGPLILGHRGASALSPENTLGAFRQALDDGADGIEFDVRLASDDVPVVIHDASLKRTAQLDGLVRELTSVELSKIDVGRWFYERRNDQPVSPEFQKLPSLKQVFDLFSGNNGVLYLEMKCGADHRDALAAAVVHHIYDAQISARVVVECFDLAAISAVRKIDPGIRTAALFEPKLSQPISSMSRKRLLDLARGCGADEVALHHKLARRKTVEAAKEGGFDVVVWTVDGPGWVARARAWGIKALISNNPGYLVHYRNSLTE